MAKNIATHKSVTDTLMRAMECAEEMKNVIVIYETHEDSHSASGGILTQEEVPLSKINWLLDLGKSWLFSPDER